MSRPAPRRFYPQRLQYAFALVGGHPEAEYRPVTGRLLAGIVGGFLLVAAGVFLVVFGASEEEIELILLGLFLPVVGFFLAWKMWRVWGQKVFVCAEGLVRQCGRRIDCCRWTEIKEVIEKGGKTTSYRLVPCKGREWVLDADSTGRVKRLMLHIRHITEKHSIPWKVEKPKDD
jgi:hypothetical protein